MFGQTAPTIPSLTYAMFSGNPVAPIVAIGVFIVTLILAIPLAAVIGEAWAGVIKFRLKARLKEQLIELKQQVITLKQQMIERGMTADEIVRVLGPPSEASDDLPKDDDDDEANAVNAPYAGEVIVERQGGWHGALALRRSGERYLIHICPGYFGAETSYNEWVDADRVQFRESSIGPDGSPRESADRTGAFGASQWCAQPKMGSVPAEV